MFAQEYEHDRELTAGERKFTYYKVAVAVLVLLLLALILWQVVFMAKERELDERLDRVEAFIEQLESGGPSWAEGERLFEEGRQTLDEIRNILYWGE